MSKGPKYALLRLSSKAQHAIVENDFFTVLNAKPSGFPAVIPSRSEHPDPSPQSLTISKLRRPSWFTESMPYLCFVPAHNPFQTEWLSPLDYAEDAIPIVRDDGMFTLRRDVMQLWTLLERDIRKLLRAAMRLADIGIAGNFRFWSYPKQYAYCELHLTEAAARRQVIAARDAFLPLSAAVSYFILRFKSRIEARDLQSGIHPGDSQDLEEGQWREVLELLQKETSLSSIWLNYWRNFLQQATVVGVYFEINNATPECLHLIPVLAKARVPLGLCWGDARSTWYIPTALRARGPLYEVLDCLAQIRYGHGRLEANEIQGLGTQVAMAQSGRYATVRIKEDLYEILTPTIIERYASVTNQSPSALSRSLPQVLSPRMGSHSDEDMRNFFRRRQQQRDFCLARESPVDRQRRLQRESVAARDLPPGRKGATVFYWELVDGVRRRTPAGRQNYETYWETYGPNQRRYDSVRNEWDVCTDFDPEDTPSWSDDESDAYEPGCTSDLQMLPDQDEDDALDTQGDSLYLQHLHGQQNPTQAHPPIEFSDPLEEFSYYRFGLVDQVEGSEVPNGNVMDWERVPNLLGNARSKEAPQLRKSTRHILRVFLTALLRAHNLSEAPKNLDLNVEDSDIQGDWSFSVIYKDVMDGYYFIKPRSLDSPFELALKSPGVVLEIARRGWGPDLMDIVRNLMREGIPFNTFIRDTPRAQELEFPRCRPLLGYRCKDFMRKGSVQVPEQVLEEYRAYEYQRDRFLQTKRGRAAVLAGGLIARLARHIVKEEVVLQGPSNDVWSSGQCIWDGYQDSLGCWDDQLTESEIDLICGVYDVGTGERDRWGYMQVAQRSWWPKPTAWKVSGLSCGYWSRDAEAWFQRRLENIINGSAVLMNNREWKASIKFTKEAYRLSQKNDQLAGLYLKRRFETH